MTAEPRFAAEALQAFAQRMVTALGTPADIAEEVARHLVNANLSGHDSHGVMRLPQYAGQVERKELAPAARPSIVRENGSAAVVDAQRGFGHYATRFALDVVVGNARRRGLAAAAIRHSTHIGRLGEYTERCAELGLVLLMTIGMAGPGVGGMVVHGGRERFFGAGVWSIGVPGMDHSLVFDASMANIAVGKVWVAKAAGQSLPSGCIIDRDGQPSNDPDHYFAGGAVVPLGGDVAGHKGYGLALAASLLGGLAMIGDDDPTLAGAPVAKGADPVGRMAGVFLLAIDPEAFGGLAIYRQLVEDCLVAVKRVSPAPGFTEVSVPGEFARRSREQRLRDGVPLAQATCDELAALAARLKVAMPAPLAA
jgi:hydroxycarboxylate dehydrogenase B